VRRSEFEIVVGAQERQIVPNAQLGEQCVDRTDLDTSSATRVPEIGRSDMVISIRL
jgi:hypothetical protein